MKRNKGHRRLKAMIIRQKFPIYLGRSTEDMGNHTLIHVFGDRVHEEYMKLLREIQAKR